MRGAWCTSVSTTAATSVAALYSHHAAGMLRLIEEEHAGRVMRVTKQNGIDFLRAAAALEDVNKVPMILIRFFCALRWL